MLELIYRIIIVVLLVNIRVLVCNSDEKTGDNNKTSKMEGFVVGGSETHINNFPHAVYLTVHCVTNMDEYWICGSSILNQKLLLTAAHCLYGCTGKLLIEATAGTSNVQKVNIMRRVRRYVFHGKYDPVSDYCDIAVCLIQGYFPLGKLMQRVIIRKSFSPGTKGEVAGWGVISDSYMESPKLKRVFQEVRPVYECRHVRILPGMMCVSSKSQRDYPAVGDSGSALVTSQKQQIGIVSFKSRSKKAEMIVYTNVSHFYDWIVSQSKRLWCGKII